MTNLPNHKVLQPHTFSTAATPLDSSAQWMSSLDACPGGLSRAKERDLALRIQAGDEHALTELVTSNLRFAVSVAKRYQNRGVPLADLIAEANAGLVHAARKFDPDKGVKFISYAVWWIRQAVLTAIAEQSRAVRVPSNRNSQINRISQSQSRLIQRLGRAPSEDEIAAECGFEPDLVRDLMMVMTPMLRLDATPFNSGDRPLGDILEDSATPSTADVFETNEQNRLLRERLAIRLRPREMKVLERYFGLDGQHGATLEKIGEEMGITRERVRQIKTAALTKMRADAQLAALLMGDLA